MNKLEDRMNKVAVYGTYNQIKGMLSVIEGFDFTKENRYFFINALEKDFNYYFLHDQDNNDLLFDIRNMNDLYECIRVAVCRFNSKECVSYEFSAIVNCSIEKYRDILYKF